MALEKCGAFTISTAAAATGISMHLGLLPGGAPVGNALVGAGAISVYDSPSDERMDWKKYGKESLKGALSSAAPIVGDVAAQAVDNYLEGRPLKTDLLKVGAAECVSCLVAKSLVSIMGWMESVAKRQSYCIDMGSVVKVVAPFVEGGVEEAAELATKNVCDGKSWHKGVKKVAIAGAAGSGVKTGVGKAGKLLGTSKKGTCKFKRNSRDYKQAALCGLTVMAKRGAKKATEQLAANLHDDEELFTRVGDKFIKGSLKGMRKVTAKCLADDEQEPCDQKEC